MTKLKMRPSVKRFAEAMERVLRKNDHKEGWDELTNHHLLERMQDELQECHDEMYHRNDCREPDVPNLCNAVHEVIDLANFAMMFFDNNRDHYTKGERDD